VCCDRKVAVGAAKIAAALRADAVDTRRLGDGVTVTFVPSKWHSIMVIRSSSVRTWRSQLRHR
jgi:hypothetical protein